MALLISIYLLLGVITTLWYRFAPPSLPMQLGLWLTFPIIWPFVLVTELWARAADLLDKEF